MSKLADVLKRLVNIPEGIELYVYLKNDKGHLIKLWLDPAYPETLTASYRVPNEEENRTIVDFDPAWITNVIKNLKLDPNSEGWYIDIGTFTQLRRWNDMLEDLYVKWEAYK